MNKKIRLIQIGFLILFWIMLFIAVAQANLAIVIPCVIGFCVNLIFIAFHNRIFK